MNSINSQIVTRIAPTPSGLLHIGNGISFIITTVLARAFDGKILLRIDDLDTARFREEYLLDIFETLEWLGISYDIGPSSPADFHQNWSQKHRLSLYQPVLEQLHKAGHLFACTCSRKQIREKSTDGTYSGTCNDLNLDFLASNMAWRIHTSGHEPITFDAFSIKGNTKPLNPTYGSVMPDFVVRKKDGTPAYQVASLVDDLHFGVNFIVRGVDLLESTLAQSFLAKKLHFIDFQKVVFHHHYLIKDKRGEKLSKSKGASSLAAWRAAGEKPVKLYQQAGKWLGLPVAACERLELMVEAYKALY